MTDRSRSSRQTASSQNTDNLTLRSEISQTPNATPDISPHGSMVDSDVDEDGDPVDSEYEEDEHFDALPDGEQGIVTGLTGREKKMIWESWKLMTKDYEAYRDFGINFIVWMTENIPHVREAFGIPSAPRLTDEQLIYNQKIIDHANNFVKELEEIISLLPFPEQILARTTEMIKSHLGKTPKIGVDHFRAFFEKFHLFISKCLGEPPDAEVVKLWVRMVGSIYNLVEAEEDKLDEKEVRRRQNQCCRLM